MRWQDEDIHHIVQVLYIGAKTQKFHLRSDSQLLYFFFHLRTNRSITDEEKYHVRFLLQRCCKCIKQENVIFLKHEAPHMPHDKFIPQPQRFPQCFPFLWMKGVFGKVYRIIDDRDLSTVSQVFPIHPNSGQLAAGEVAIGKKSGKGAQNVFHDIPLRLTWGRGAVIVQDTHGYSRKPGR